VGVHYLANLERLYPNDDIAVLAAWNAGPGITKQWLKGKPYLELEDIEYSETRKFVRHVDQTFGYLKIIQGWKHLFGMAHSHGN
jgi:soluble lytic murein transglycosylase-like protein